MASVIQAPAQTLTYEAYMAEPWGRGRYDIIKKARVFQPQVTWERQRIIGNVMDSLKDYEKSSDAGKPILPPFDLLIRRNPSLQIRQPDASFITHARLEQSGGPPKVGPLEVGPELVVEIVTDSETQRILNSKLADYIEIGVNECWVVRPEARTIEIMRLTPNGSQSVRIYDDTETLTSVVFPNLSVPVADVFAP